VKRSEKTDLAITGADVCTPSGLIRGATVLTEGDKIKSVSSGPVSQGAGNVIDGSDHILLPGFTDTHAHGMDHFEATWGWFDVKTGSFRSEPDTWKRGFTHYAKKLAETGVTTAYIPVETAPVEHLQNVLDEMADYVNGSRNAREGARIAGGNIEVTFVNPEMAGAANPEYFVRPSPETLDRLNASGVVKLVNISPEFGADALSLADYAVKRGIIPGIGHTNATGDEVDEMVRHGARYVVHVMNAMGRSHKVFGGGGAVEAALRNDELFCELVSDKLHVAPAYMRDIIDRKTDDRVMAVSDQIFVSATDDIRYFELSGIPGEVSEDRTCVHVRGKPDKLFSSMLTMDVAFSNLLSMLTVPMAGVWMREHAALDFEQAVLSVSKMTATNVHRMTGEIDDVGEIAPGKRADLVLAKITGKPGNYRLEVHATIVAGKIVYRC
jgi:N-acetylglucosamine-6-phosphate deacetylase